MFPANPCESSAANASRSRTSGSRPSRAAKRSRKWRARRGYVLAALLQGRKDDLDDSEPVIQVLAKLAFGDPRGKRRVRGREDAHVDRDAGPAADALDLALLEHAQELRLERQRHVADLVQEERPAVGGLDPSDARLDAGGDAALDPEELRFEKTLGQRSAVDRHERLGRAIAAGVDHPRDELLARAALAADQDGGHRRRHPGNEIQDSAHGRRLSDEHAVSGRAAGRVEQAAVLLFQALALAGELFEMPPVLDRHSAEPGERREEAAVLFVESCRRPDAVFPVGERQDPDCPSARANRHADRGGDGGAQEPQVLGEDRRLRARDLPQEVVLGHRRLGDFREADARFGPPLSAFAERREIPPRRVENADRASQDVFDERSLVRERAERQAGVVEGLEEEKLLLGRELAPLRLRRDPPQALRGVPARPR